jgi:hypothetical protein
LTTQGIHVDNAAKTAIDLDELERELLAGKPRPLVCVQVIAELRASRKVVEAARTTLTSPTYYEDTPDLRIALAELEGNRD